ncbi:MAG: sigma-70 family RNA polymerase sigma factor [Balneolales bacterium]
MDCSELVTATLDDDQKRLNAILAELFPVLVDYLRGRMGSSLADAEDCAQQALISTLDKIKAAKINDPQRVYPYILKCCRNNYLRIIRYNGKMISNDHFIYQAIPANQLSRLLDDEKLVVLESCLNMLAEKHRTFFDYLFGHPGVESDQIASRFNISTASVWSKKHRIIQKLIKCIQKKMK